ncbi:hypothetical protein K4F52_004735 [Lecanicillium sp. MT-2017a]|nr:hypothetical protein K4F52_004735 [Lecanicillium sp. MT-2017a]
MKWSTSVTLALAPLSIASKARSVYESKPVARNTETELDGRSLAVLNGMKGHGLSLDARSDIIIIWANPGGGAKRTNINEQVTITKTVTAGAGQQQTAVPVAGGTTTISQGQTATVPATGASHTVKVGGPGGLVFQPDQMSIPAGDTVVFEFLAQNHTVTQSPFDTPCKALDGGMDSGFLANPNNTVSPAPQVAMQVMATTPLWFYCRQKGHCGKGMVFSINPTAEKTHAMFQSMAIQQNGSGEGTPITGGNGGGNPPPPAQSGEAPPAQGQQPPPAQGEQPPPAEGGNGATPGKGSVGADGSCTCVVSCNPGGFPANAQGIGATGGFGGSIPMNMAAL